MARMVQLEELQAELKKIHDLAGNTCVLIEGMTWGGRALNRERELQSLVPHPGDGSCEQCGAAPASAVETMLCGGCRELATWRREPPDEQALWWWWNEDGLPILVSILFSGKENRYFASVGQHGWNRPQWVEDMGGYWMRCFEPPYPSV